MLGAAEFATAVRVLLERTDTNAVLDELVQMALLWTDSRNVLLAIVDDELGTLELRHGAGPDWTERTSAEYIPVSRHIDEGIVAYVGATGETFVTGNVAEERRYRNLFGTSKSEMAIPVKDRAKRIRGVLNLETTLPDHYTHEHVLIGEAIAALAGIAMERREMLQREEALIQLGSGIDRAVDEEDLIERVLNIGCEVLQFQAFSIFLLDPSTQRYVLRGAAGSLQAQVGAISYAGGEGLTGWVCQNAEPTRLDHPQSDPRWKGMWTEFPNDQIASYLAVPIVVRGKCVGALRVLRKVSDNKELSTNFTEADERLLTTIAEQLALGLEGLRAVRKLVQGERMAAWGELSAKSSHMIGNRVFAVKGDVNELAHLLSEKALDREQLKDLQRSLYTNVSRIEEILQDFRDFLTATQLSKVRVEPNFLVRDAVSEVFPRRSKVRLEFSLAPDLPELAVDARRIRRALSELVENCLNHFDQGSLYVRTRLATKQDLKTSKLSQKRSYITIEVEDEGPGIEPEMKAQIFQPFFSSRVKGMGLGLSIVQGIVEAHGGTVYEAGEEGRGAKFVMLLPISERVEE